MLRRPNIKQRLESMRQLGATVTTTTEDLPTLGGLISSILGLYKKTGAPEETLRWQVR